MFYLIITWFCCMYTLMSDVGKPIDVEGEIAAEFTGRKEQPQKLHPIQSTSDARVVNNVMRHTYRVLEPWEKAAMQQVKDKGLEFIELLPRDGGSRELAIAKTKIEEAVMWAVKHITK